MVPEEGEKLAASSLGAHYVETSAKSNSTISTAFELLTQKIYEDVERGHGAKLNGNENQGPTADQPQETENQSRARGKCLCWCPWVEQPHPLKPMKPS